MSTLVTPASIEGFSSRNRINGFICMKKTSSVSNATITVSERRSDTIDPSTLLNDAFSRWAT